MEIILLHYFNFTCCVSHLKMYASMHTWHMATTSSECCDLKSVLTALITFLWHLHDIVLASMQIVIKPQCGKVKQGSLLVYLTWVCVCACVCGHCGVSVCVSLILREKYTAA